MSAEPAPSLPGWLRRLVGAAAGVGARDFLRYGPGAPPEGGRPSSVLILLAAGADGPEVLLIQRADQLRKHAGQPAFPGGAADPDDRGPADTALREAAEEVGLDPASVQVVALLPELYLAPTGYAVTPVLAWWHTPHEVGVVDPGEVARVDRVPMAELADPANRCRVRHPSGYIGPAFAIRGMLVWGFTGAVLDRLLELADWARPWDPDDVRDLPQRTLDLAARGLPAGGPQPGGGLEDDGPAADEVIPARSFPSPGGHPGHAGTVER